MTTYNDSLIENPWLSGNKLTAPISVRGISGVNYYIEQKTTSNAIFTINAWFRPKWVYVKTIADPADTFFSIWYAAEIDWVIQVSTIYKNINDMQSLWTWDNDTVYIMWHDPLLDPDFARRITVVEFTDTWVKFDANLLWDDYILEIIVYK